MSCFYMVLRQVRTILWIIGCTLLTYCLCCVCSSAFSYQLVDYQWVISLKWMNWKRVSECHNYFLTLAFALGSFWFINFCLHLASNYSGQKQSSHGVTQKDNIPVSVSWIHASFCGGCPPASSINPLCFLLFYRSYFSSASLEHVSSPLHHIPSFHQAATM